MPQVSVITIHLAVFIGLSRTGEQSWLSVAQDGTLSVVSITTKRGKKVFKEMEMLEFESAVMEVRWPQQNSPHAKCV